MLPRLAPLARMVGRKPLLTAFAQLLLALWVEPSDIVAGRADTERVRFPPVFEGRMLDAD